VEDDASHRALAWLENNRMLSPEEHAGAIEALNWAARTYVAAAIVSLSSLLYFISLLKKNRSRNN
jgi:Zn-dependent membrane protease YugP